MTTLLLTNKRKLFTLPCLYFSRVHMARLANYNYLRCSVFFAALTLSLAAWSAEPAPTAPIEDAKIHSTMLTRIQEITERASDLVSKAFDFIGTRYRRGGNNQEQGLDCSGLVRLVFKEVVGMHLPRTALEISQRGESITLNELQPGDLVFFNTLKRNFSHVGIYIGENKFIHAPSSGGEVRVENMDISYWKKRFNGARRIQTF